MKSPHPTTWTLKSALGLVPGAISAPWSCCGRGEDGCSIPAARAPWRFASYSERRNLLKRLEARSGRNVLAAPQQSHWSSQPRFALSRSKAVQLPPPQQQSMFA